MTKVPLLDLREQYATIRDEVREAMDRVCESQHFIMGPDVKEFEDELSTFCGVPYAIGMSSGTDALLAALMAIGIGPGDEVVTSPYTFFATAGCIARLGARPVFVDIRADTFNLDSAQLEGKLGPRTKAIVPIHLFGRCADMSEIVELARERNLYVIEDAAQAIGGRDRSGRQAGTIGDIGCFSFFPSKNLGAFGDGGMAITHDAELADRLRIIRVHGSKPKYYHHCVGGNFRLDTLQAAVLRVKLKYLPQWTEARRAKAARYRTLIQELGLDFVRFPDEVPGHIYHQFVARFPARDGLQRFLRDRGIETAIYYPVPLHLQACFAELGYRRGDFPEAEKAADESLALPLYPEISEADQRYVAQQIQSFYR